MNKKDIAELKKRLSKSGCTFTKLRGCYVNADKEIVVHINETFLNLEEEEFFKYLEIAKKTMSGTLGNNLLELPFPIEEESAGGKQQFLMGLKDSALKNDDLLQRFYELVIENYEYAGNFLILLFHDAYDVITKTTDNNNLDESEEVYEYIIGAICPVTLSKPGLGYREDENRIGSRIRDWVVDVPDTGFIFPAFTDRSTDIHSLLFYTKNTKEPHTELIEGGFGCVSKKTATVQKQIFSTIIKDAICEDEDKTNDILMDIQENLSYMIEEKEDVSDDEEPIMVTNNTLKTIMNEVGVPEDAVTKIERSYTEEFGEEPPVAEYLVDSKALAVNAQKKREQGLAKEVLDLKQQLKEMTVGEGDNDVDVVVRVKPQKVPLIVSQVIDGQKCIVIPIDDNEKTVVNGIEEEL